MKKKIRKKPLRKKPEKQPYTDASVLPYQADLQNPNRLTKLRDAAMWLHNKVADPFWQVAYVRLAMDLDYLLLHHHRLTLRVINSEAENRAKGR